ncbi:putative golgin subfamily A member 6-like protein 3 [Cajanus cajan]|uniref:putative golgin subfamily A member 6-like protein 3 n=1 Tax=Cajanus cajan TaxID=3821 RepID=UPI00098DAA1E|nr:putative golgin subfamily A member 6-like protein 3 [Cajanus cajan]
MAKKKVTHQSQAQNLKHSPMASDDSVSMQFQNLKNLNAVLLKETTHHRQQIDSLNSALYCSAVASDVVSAFFQSHARELTLRLHALLADNQSQIARLRSETKLLEENAVRESNLRLEAQELLSQTQRAVEELNRQRDSALDSSREAVAVIETLKREIDDVTRERNEIRSVNQGYEKELAALTHLNECLKKEEVFARQKILQVEENLGLALQKEEEMALEIGVLLKEKKEMENTVEVLTQQNCGVLKDLDEVQRELMEKKHELDEAIRLSDEMEQVKVNCESEIVELRRLVDESRASCKKFEEVNEQLLSEVKRYRDAVDEAVLEKENMKKVFEEENEKLLLEVKRCGNAVDEAVCEKESIERVLDEERKKVEKLKLVVAETKESSVKIDAELGKVKSERDKLVEKEKMLEGNVNVLREKNEALQSKLEDALTLLKTTAATLVCQVKDRGEEAMSDENVVEEMDPYVQELDAIKKAFKSKDKTVDDMKKQLVSLNQSVVRAQKSKNLWTVISSATTLFVAVLTAYVARGR